MTDHTEEETKTLMNSFRSSRGYSLIELLTALVLTSIVTTSFLGIMTLFSKVNQKSRTILLATAAANNRYERMKSYSLSELAQMPDHQTIIEESFILQTDMERYYPEIQDEAQYNYLDLVIKSNGESGFLSYLAAENLQEFASLDGNGSLSIRMKPEDGGMLIQMSDEDGKTAVFHFSTPSLSTIFNIHTQQMKTGQLVQVDIDEPFPGHWKINVYEPPFPRGQILFFFNDEIYQTDQHMKQINLDGFSIQAVKQQEMSTALVYLHVRVYTAPADNKPVSSCQGVIKIPF